MLSFILPAFITVELFCVYGSLYEAVNVSNQMLVLEAALKLVLLNTIRAFPHYIAVFILSERIQITKNGKEYRMLKSVLICLLIPVIYKIIERIYGIRYDFGVPAVLMFSIIVIQSNMKFDRISIVKKLVMIAIFLTSFQFLDVTPMLNRFHFGQGDTSQDIKTIADFLGMSRELNLISLLFFILLFFMGVLLFLLILDEKKVLRVMEESKNSREALHKIRIRELENRTYREMQNLVHDLKTPLTVMQVMLDTLELTDEKDKRSTYIGKIEDSIERMNLMTSEILFDELLSPIEANKLLKNVLSQISPLPYSKCLKIINNSIDSIIKVNSVSMSRALINVIENAYYAIDKDTGVIELELSDEGEWVTFTIKDNGVGIDENDLLNIRQRGYSTRASHGLGLNYVEQVVEQSNGYLKIKSIENEGTIVSISIPIIKEINS